MKIRISVFVLLLLPSISSAHDFWIFREGNEVKIYGGHDFPKTEMAPGKNIVVHSYIYGKGGMKELVLERGENFLFSKGVEGAGVLAFNFERGGKIVYCGFYIPDEESIVGEEMVKKTCGDTFSILKKIQQVKIEKEVSIEFFTGFAESLTLYTEKGDKSVLFPDNGKISFKAKKGGLFLLISEISGRPVSIVIEVK
jgi:hypothetical protein